MITNGQSLVNEQYVQTHEDGRLRVAFSEVQLGLHIVIQVEECVYSHRRDFCACYPLDE